MQRAMTKYFLYSAGILLGLVGLAKLFSSAGHIKALEFPDPIFLIPFRYLFLIVGSLEMIVASICFFGKRPLVQSGLVAWLASMFLVYRVGLILLDYHLPCPCLGSLTAILHMPANVADMITKVILGYLLLGSIAILITRRVKHGPVPVSVV